MALCPRAGAMLPEVKDVKLIVIMPLPPTLEVRDRRIREGVEAFSGDVVVVIVVIV